MHDQGEPRPWIICQVARRQIAAPATIWPWAAYRRAGFDEA